MAGVGFVVSVWRAVQVVARGGCCGMADVGMLRFSWSLSGAVDWLL